MLYVSTRDSTNIYTAHRALYEQHTSDGGMFVPFRFPVFSYDEILQMKSRSFGTNVAQILNLFFSTRLNGWDVDCCCGRIPVNLVSLPRKLLVVELWNNTAHSYAHVEHALYDKLCGGNAPEKITTWAKIAIQIAFFFAVFSLSVQENQGEVFDVALDDSEFIAPMAAWYARHMGLPIGTIICGSNDNSSAWDLLHRGELNAASDTPNLGLEQLIYITLGPEQAFQFASACRERRSYHVDGDQIKQLADRMFVAVTSSDRVNTVIASFNRTNNYVLDPFAAISFGALQDYRARIGESKSTMLFSMQKLKINNKQ